MRFPDGTLIGDLNDNFSAKTSQSISFIDLSTTDENQTTYDLLPVIINRPPEIVRPITEASQPTIKPYEVADATGDSMYLFPDGTVKINLGASLTLNIDAQQPSVLNIENGIPKIIPSKVALIYKWKKDGEMVTTGDIVDTLYSSITINQGSLIFENIQPFHAGTYTCEITNDIGTTTSEPITIEVLNLDFDAFFYRNLVKNPYGVDGTTDWEASNSELTVRAFSKNPSEDFIQPHRVDRFGYTIDMLHPRPYQIDAGVISKFDMTKDLLQNNASYFTRTKYKFESKGGSHVVKAYQDIDLTDIEWLIRGGVFGVEGVRAMFSCYIGNGITSFVPVQELIDPSVRTRSTNYVQNKSRLSLENFLNSGPASGVNETAYVTVEEYDNETRLSSKLLQSDGSVIDYLDRIVLTDPWQKRMWKYSGQKYYTNDKYGLGELSSGDGRDQILFAADELYPDQKRRYAYGQYGEFNKVVFDRLNPSTTKVRIAINFETTDWRIFEQWKEAMDASDEVREFVGWETPFGKHKFTKPPTTSWKESIIRTILEQAALRSSSFSEAVPSANEPRGMVTALNFSLIPILTQQKDTTKYYTDSSLAINTSPTSSVPSGLGVGRGYDPYGVFQKKWIMTLKHYSDPVPKINNLNIIEVVDMISIQLDETRGLRIGNKIVDVTRVGIDPISVLPFEKGTAISLEGFNKTLTKTSINSTDVDTQTKWYAFSQATRFALIPEISWMRENKQVSKDYKQSTYTEYLSTLVMMGMTAPNSGTRLPDPNKDVEAQWNRKIRLLLHYSVAGADITPTVMPPFKVPNSVAITGTAIVPANLSTNLIDNGISDGFVNAIANTSNSIWTERDYNKINTLPPRDGITSEQIQRDLSSQKLQSYYLDIDFSQVRAANDGNSTVRLWRTADMLGSGSGEVFLSHSIDPYGLLDCEIPQSFVTTPVAQAGMGYSAAIVTNAYKYTQTIPDALDTLYKNVGAYIKDGNLRGNTYYTSTVNEIFKPIEDELSKISGIVNITALRAFSASLSAFAYNPKLPQPQNKTFKYIKATWSIDATNPEFDRRVLFQEITGSISRPPQLYGFRSTQKSWERPSLVGVESVDPATYNDGFVTPTFGIDKFENEYSIYYGGIQDTVAGTYKSIIPTGSNP